MYVYILNICSITGPSNHIAETIDESSNNPTSEVSSEREPYPPGVHPVAINHSLPKRGLARKNNIVLYYNNCININK